MRDFWRIVRTVFSSLFLATVTIVGAPIAMALTVFAGLIFLPLPATLPIPKAASIAEPSVIYDRDGNVIATLQQFNQNIPVAESDIPAVLKEAVVADEDRNFYHHGGVDVRGTLRAIWSDVRGNGPLQGGSTITQQYVKLAYTGTQRNLTRKIREAILASQLDRQASKDQILYRYLSIVYLGDGDTGVGAAAEAYFHVPVNQLDASQAATLSGLIPAPSARAPREHLASAEKARELVLGKMHQQGYLDDAQYRRAMAEKLALAGANPPPAPNATLVYPVTAAAPQYPDFVNYVTQWLLAHYPPSVVYGGGLRVQTTLDPHAQDAAHAAVQSTLAGTSDPLEMALAAVEPQTGFVDAVVGGRAFGEAGAAFAADNFAIGGCDPRPAAGAAIEVAATCWSGPTVSGGGAGRQPGSAWKPFVLATAFEQGIQPGAVYAAPGVYAIPGCKPSPAQTCAIHNDEPGSQLGSETLAQATVESTNTVYAQVAAQVGCPNVATTAKALGIDSAYYSSSTMPFCPTYALGVVDVSPLDMASAYGVFADHGQRAAPTPILEIVDAAGKVLVDNIHHPVETSQVLPANVADNVTNVLQGVLTNGTGTAAALGRPAAGKTGTTSDYTNAWFVGYTPTLSAAVWMGGDAHSQTVSLGRVKGVEPVYGGTWPALTWKAFMTRALEGVSATPFSQPAPIIPPAVAKALQTPTTAVPATVVPRPEQVIGTPLGGPYEESPPTAAAPPAPTPTTTTTVPLSPSTSSTSSTTPPTT